MAEEKKEEKKSTFWQDFKAFITKGNVLDLAVGVVMGSAFGKITTSLVNDVIMPPIGMLIGQVNFSDLKIVLTEAVDETAEVAINYGVFIQTILDFLLIALCVFAAVRIVKNVEKKIDEKKKKEPPKPAEPPKPSEEVLLLREIRDSLKK